MKSYFDSSVLVKLYVTEAGAGEARRAARAVKQVPLTWLHVLEVGNALRVLVGRRVIESADAELVMGDFAEDRRAYRLLDMPVDWPSVFSRAENLSIKHASRTLARSLDILHVAAALELKCTRFVTADERQAALAASTGLTVVDIRQPS